MNLKLTKFWLKHRNYFIVGMGLVLFTLIFSFDKSPISHLMNKNKVQNFQLSSVALSQKQIEQTEYQALQNLNEREMIAQLEKNRSQWARNDEPYAVNYATIEEIEKKSKKRLHKRFEKNPVFQLLDIFSTNPISIEYEDMIVCDKGRQFYENKIEGSLTLKSLAESRNVAGLPMPQQCVTYSMKQHQVPKTSYAVCSQASGAAQIPGSKPCITPNLVNLTFNSFMDVTDCLNINPKHLMPKIDFESGFFLNSFGQEKQAGIGQLSRPAIAEVNEHFDEYLVEIEKAAVTKPSCANLLKYKNLLTPGSAAPEQRCSIIGLPENPLRNILYTALLNRINMDQISGIKYLAGKDYLNIENTLVSVQNSEADELTGQFKNFNIKAKLEKLGLKNINMHFFKELIALLGYNTGLSTAMNLLNSYLDQRIENGLSLTWADFDFYLNPQKVDIDGKEKSLVEIARSYVLSSMIDPKDSPDLKLIKMNKRKELPKLWAESFNESFPVFVTYRANSYTGKSLDKFALYGYPGYLSLIVDRNQKIRTLFMNSDLNADSCVDPNFLKVPSIEIKSSRN